MLAKVALWAETLTKTKRGKKREKHTKKKNKQQTARVAKKRGEAYTGACCKLDKAFDLALPDHLVGNEDVCDAAVDLRSAIINHASYIMP